MMGTLCYETMFFFGVEIAIVSYQRWAAEEYQFARWMFGIDAEE